MGKAAINKKKKKKYINFNTYEWGVEWAANVKRCLLRMDGCRIMRPTYDVHI